MNPTTEMQEEPVDRFKLHARIKMMGKNQRYLAEKLNRSDSAITRAMKGELPVLLRRIERHITWLEQKQNKQSTLEPAAQS